MTGYFVTGTDTDVGKTHVAVALTRYLRGQGARVFAFKPIETGCSVDEHGVRLGEDQRALCEAAGGWQQGDLQGVYRLAMPVAPVVAALAEGLEINLLSRIAEVFRTGSASADAAVVEGAGGWRVPVTQTADMATMAQLFGLPVIIVGRAGLGTINHTLLTIEAVERDGCAVAAVVISRRPDDDRAFAQSNAEEIAKRWRGLVRIYEGDAGVFDAFHVEQRDQRS
jgi:dethiobiotin synthetase